MFVTTLALVLAMSTPQAADPLPDTPAFLETGSFGPELMLDTSFKLVGAPSDQTSPSISFDGTNYLAVWVDAREGNGIYCGRVTPEGALLDSAGLLVSPSLLAMEPVVAFGVSTYLAVWETDTGVFRDVRAARITPDGVTLDSGGFGLSAALGRKISPTVTYADSCWLVAWTDMRDGGGDIYATRVTRSGQVLDLHGIPVSIADGDQGFPSVSTDGTNYLVVWTDWRTADIRCARIRPDGSVVDTESIIISAASGQQYAPSVVFNGVDFVVVWEDSRLGDLDLYGARVSSGGVVLDTAGFLLSDAVLRQSHVCLACDGQNVLATWRDGRSGEGEDDVYSARISRQGVVLDTGGIAVSQAEGEQRAPSVAFGGNDFMVVWDDSRESEDFGSDIYAARVSTSGKTLDTSGMPVSLAANTQRNVAAGTDGDAFLVAWTEQVKEGNTDIWGARVSASGSILDPAGFWISSAGSYQFSPNVAYAESNYLVVWGDRRYSPDDRIYGARVTQGGVVLDRGGFMIPPDLSGWLSDADVASSGSNYLVAFTRTVGLESDIIAARVTPAGQVLDPTGFPVCTEAHHGSLSPVVAFDGTNYLVAWFDQRRLEGGDVYAARITPDGVVLDRDGFVVNEDAASQSNAVIASDHSGWLVAYEDMSFGRPEIHCVRLTPDGAVIDTHAIRLARGVHNQLYPTAASDSAGYLVMWEEYVGGGATDVRGVRLRPTGVVTDSFVAVSGTGFYSLPSLVGNQNDRLLLAYTSWTGFEQQNRYNSYRAWAKLSPLAGVKEAAPPIGGVEARPLRVWPSVVSRELNLAGCSKAVLLDASGRKVLDLKAGKNDVHGLSRGIYFVCPPSDVRREASGVAKVVLTR
jgi:hypothetical protein